MNWFKKLKRIYRDLITAAAWGLVILFGYIANLTQIDVLYTLTFVFLIPAIVFTIFAVKANKIKTDALVSKEPVPVTKEPVPVTKEPVPVTKEPVPVTKEPAPVTKEPAPVITEHAPIIDSYEYKKFKIVGVTFKNDDGSSRQSVLRKMKFRDGEFSGVYNIELNQYDYEGAPAYGVYANNKMIGNLPKDMVAYVSSVASRADVVDIDVYGGGSNSETGEKMSYGATITLKIKKE